MEVTERVLSASSSSCERMASYWSLIYVECCKRKPSAARLQSAAQEDNQ